MACDSRLFLGAYVIRISNKITRTTEMAPLNSQPRPLHNDMGYNTILGIEGQLLSDW
jgi:hypothetical protein